MVRVLEGFRVFLVVALLLGVQTAHAETDKDHYPIGQVVALEGRAFYAAGDQDHTPMKLNDPVFMNTVVETGPQSKVLILFVDNTEITLGEDSELVIDEYVFDPYDAQENKGSFEITKGAFLWVSGLISKREDPDVFIKTNVGSIGIRGTKFWGGNVGSDGYGVYVFDGVVNYTTQKDAVRLSKDHGVTTGGENTALRTQDWPAERLNSAVQTVTFAAQEEVIRAVKAQRQANVEKQHDYRARMFPYKANPLEPHLKDKGQEFFTDEFEQLQERQK